LHIAFAQLPTINSQLLPSFTSEADESSAGPASLSATDPDGNPMFVEQHL
jgi:hypothetical protein